MKNKSYKYDINKPRLRHGHKYTKYKIRLIKQHLKFNSLKS